MLYHTNPDHLDPYSFLWLQDDARGHATLKNKAKPVKMKQYRASATLDNVGPQNVFNPKQILQIKSWANGLVCTHPQKQRQIGNFFQLRLLLRICQNIWWAILSSGSESFSEISDFGHKFKFTSVKCRPLTLNRRFLGTDWSSTCVPVCRC